MKGRKRRKAIVSIPLKTFDLSDDDELDNGIDQEELVSSRAMHRKPANMEMDAFLEEIKQQSILDESTSFLESNVSQDEPIQESSDIDIQQEFSEILSQLTIERESIRNAMMFVYDNSYHSNHLIHAIHECISSSSISLVKLKACLYLITDITFNVSTPCIPNGYQIRQDIELILESVIQSTKTMYASIKSRITAQSFYDIVLSCLHCMRKWNIFTDEFLDRLEMIITPSFIPSLQNDSNSRIDGVHISDCIPLVQKEIQEYFKQGFITREIKM